MLITFSGIDCSGKSTQLKRLAEALRREGCSVRELWLRPGYSPELDALRKAVRAIRPSALPTTRQGGARKQVFSRKSVQAAWVAMAVSDMAFQYGIRLRQWLASGQVVLCDRYIDDACLDLDLRFPAMAPVVRRTPAAMRRICPTPALQFLIRISHEEMLRRMEIKKEPFPDAPDIRDRRLAHYDAFAEERSERIVLNGERSIEQLHSDVLGQVRAVLSAQ